MNLISFIWDTQEASLVAQAVKNLPVMQEAQVSPWVRKMPGRGKWQPTPGFLPGESQGWGRLVGCRLWGRRVGHA